MRAHDEHSTDTTTVTAIPAAPVCRRCGARMRWDSYLASSQRGVALDRNGRAPLSWAWHCRCGMWVYGHRRDRG